MDCYNRTRLLLQFHITGRCNLRCKHCYRTEGDVEPLSYDEVIRVLEQFKELLRQYNADSSRPRRGHVNLTGGEPFIREDIREILTYLGDNKAYFTYGILSNGSFLNDETVALLRQTEVSFVQMSLDGDRAVHDSLRALGDYDRVLQTAEWLERCGIRTYISFTAIAENDRYLPTVAKECRRRGITKLWSDRLVPIGNGEDLAALSITREQLPAYLQYLKKAQGTAWQRWRYPKTQVTANRALQFLRARGEVYACSAGDTLITVDEFGNILPCRRMPIVCGNVAQTTLLEVYRSHEVFRQLRTKAIPRECAACPYAYLCRGGARCQAYARWQSFFRADPACPLVQPTDKR